MKKKYIISLWVGRILALPSFLSLFYFPTGDNIYLFFICFLGFFSFFFLKTSEENLAKNNYFKAVERSFMTFGATLLFACLFIAQGFLSLEVIILFMAVGWSSSIVVYVAALKRVPARN
jgi:uncharacterized membrane protein